jgi:hypothetical protein
MLFPVPVLKKAYTVNAGSVRRLNFTWRGSNNMPNSKCGSADTGGYIFKATSLGVAEVRLFDHNGTNLIQKHKATLTATMTPPCEARRLAGLCSPCALLLSMLLFLQAGFLLVG